MAYAPIAQRIPARFAMRSRAGREREIADLKAGPACRQAGVQILLRS